MFSLKKRSNWFDYRLFFLFFSLMTHFVCRTFCNLMKEIGENEDLLNVSMLLNA